MPDRASSRGLLFAGVALVLAAAPMIAVPVLLDRAETAQTMMAQNDELQRVVAAVTGIRDALDLMRDARIAQRDYLLSGAPEDRAAFASRTVAARDAVARLGVTAFPVLAWRELSRLTTLMLRELEAGAALRGDGAMEAAVALGRTAGSREMMAEIDATARDGVAELRRQYGVVLNSMLTAGDVGEQFARVMFGMAGISVALGGIALVAYQRRRAVAERALRSGRDAALAASLLKTRFVATASHDLRQPLHAISMFVGVLRRRSQDPAVREVVDNVATAVASMQRMFAALLDVARLDAGAIKVERRVVELQPLFEALKVEFGPSATARGVSLQVAPTPLAVLSDPAILETILRNLLSNAVKFTDHGVVGVMARPREGAVELTVFDTGIGIAPDDQGRVFEQFERVGPSGGPREGLGLGLSIVQRMAGLLEAPVRVASQPGLGSRFSLVQPAARLEVAVAAPAAAPAADLRGARILVLDDHDEARRAIALAVETLGGVACPAASLAEALALVDATAAPLRAAIVDHDLGEGQTGPQFLDAYAGRMGHALPAVVVTGSTDAATLARLRESGRTWLIKPVDLDVLGPLLERLVAPETLDASVG